MTKTLWLLLWLAAPGQGRQAAIRGDLVIKVAHPAKARATLLERARALGGHPALVTSHEVELRVPPAKLATLMKEASGLGLVLKKEESRQDLTVRIAQLAGQLRSKGEILERMRKLVDDSDVSATLAIERSMGQLVGEVEAVTGELRVARERARWATLRVAFQFRERKKIIYVVSPFEWLNSVDLEKFRARF